MLATYTEFGQNEPPRTRGLMPQAPPPVPQDSAVLDSDRVPVQIEGGELFVQRVTVSSTTHLSIWSAGTGTFAIIADGVVASDDGDLRPAPAVAGSTPKPVWQNQDPQLRDGFWTIHAPGQTLQLPLPEALRPSPGRERQVSIQVLVGTGSQGPWQVQASHAVPVLSHAPAFPQTAVHLMTHTEDR